MFNLYEKILSINNESSIDLFNQDLIQTNETSMSEEQRSSLRSSQWFSKVFKLYR